MISRFGLSRIIILGIIIINTDKRLDFWFPVFEWLGQLNFQIIAFLQIQPKQSALEDYLECCKVLVPTSPNLLTSMTMDTCECSLLLFGINTIDHQDHTSPDILTLMTRYLYVQLNMLLFFTFITYLLQHHNMNHHSIISLSFSAASMHHLSLLSETLQLVPLVRAMLLCSGLL